MYHAAPGGGQSVTGLRTGAIGLMLLGGLTVLWSWPVYGIVGLPALLIAVVASAVMNRCETSTSLAFGTQPVGSFFAGAAGQSGPQAELGALRTALLVGILLQLGASVGAAFWSAVTSPDWLHICRIFSAVVSGFLTLAAIWFAIAFSSAVTMSQRFSYYETQAQRAGFATVAAPPMLPAFDGAKYDYYPPRVQPGVPAPGARRVSGVHPDDIAWEAPSSGLLSAPPPPLREAPPPVVLPSFQPSFQPASLQQSFQPQRTSPPAGSWRGRPDTTVVSRSGSVGQAMPSLPPVGARGRSTSAMDTIHGQPFEIVTTVTSAPDPWGNQASPGMGFVGGVQRLPPPHLSSGRRL